MAIAWKQFDWLEIQTYYDAGNSGRACATKFGFKNQHWGRAVANGKMKPRSNSEGVSLALRGRHLSQAHKEAVRRGMNRAVAEGRQRTPRPGGICAKILYKGISLDGRWELRVAKWLDIQGIEWKRPKDKFKYLFDGRIKSYTPDFYIPSLALFIEVKGYQTPKDSAKWVQFTGNLLILKAAQINALDTSVLQTLIGL